MAAAGSEIQFRLNTQYVPAFAPELAFLFPSFETSGEPGTDAQWIGIMCDHPKYVRTNWGDIPKASVYVRYRFGRRHQHLLLQNGRAWALRRVEMLMRLLLKRLSREVAKVK